MEAVAAPGLAMTEQDLKTGLSLMGEGTRSAPASLPSLGIAVALDGVGQVAVARVVQESPAAYSGQVGVGDVVEAVDGRMVTSVQQLAVAADGLVRFSCPRLLSPRTSPRAAHAHGHGLWTHDRRTARSWRWSCAGGATPILSRCI
jgi:hypothetical protein